MIRMHRSECACDGCPNKGGQCGNGSVAQKVEVMAENEQPAEQTKEPEGSGSTASETEPALIEAGERVLPTLDHDGKRRWISPKLAKGVLWKYRRVLSYFLMLVFLITPHLRWGGKPLILLDIAHRKFLIFGYQFLPTDTPLLAIAVVATVLVVVFATAVVGRVWCGWACPQTVYLEFLFRPIDRFFTGTVGKGGAPKGKIPPWKQVARVITYIVLSAIIANSFLAFFVGTDALWEWIQSPPTEHPVPFLVMAVVTVGMVFDFLWFREQFCTVACPYGRFQSVMLDRNSLIVAYDDRRGEPRHKGKKVEARNDGDCVDCNQCVVVCPTGIDIRDGLQMECINCTQCIDACDAVMAKVKLPTGLIRYTSQDSLEGRPYRFWRARTIIYPTIVAVLCVLFVFALDRVTGLNARLLRGAGQPFVMDGRTVQNSVRLRVVNRTDQPQSYTVEVIDPPDVETRLIEGSLELDPLGTEIAPLMVRFPSYLTSKTGRCSAQFQVRDESGNERVLKMNLIGPSQ